MGILWAKLWSLFGKEGTLYCKEWSRCRGQRLFLNSVPYAGWCSCRVSASLRRVDSSSCGFQLRCSVVCVWSEEREFFARLFSARFLVFNADGGCLNSLLTLCLSCCFSQSTKSSSLDLTMLERPPFSTSCKPPKHTLHTISLVLLSATRT